MRADKHGPAFMKPIEKSPALALKLDGNPLRHNYTSQLGQFDSPVTSDLIKGVAGTAENVFDFVPD